MKTTAKHFKIFKAECEKWINRFGLFNWEVGYYHKEDGDTSTFSWTVYRYSGRAVDVCLNRTWQDRPYNMEYELRLSAFHEVCEILLYPLRYLGECRFLSDGEIDPEVHSIIRILESVLWRKGK